MFTLRCARVALFFGSLLISSIALAEPPVVKQASPDDGQAAVDPATKELRIVFDQAMDKRGFSVVGGGENFPKVLGRGRFVDDKTFVMPIQLKPDHDYWLSINNASFQNFRSTKGEVAVPYPISFHTAAAGGAGAATAPVAKLSKEENAKAVAELREAIQKQYSYKDDRGVDWDAAFKEYGPKMENATSPGSFASVAGLMLAKAKDLHIWLKADGKTYASARRAIPANMSMVKLPTLVPGWKKQSPIVWTGRFEDGIGYILISGWDSSDPQAIEPAFEALGQAGDAKGMIIDVRPNSGGDEVMAQKFAGCFVDTASVYSKNTIIADGKFEGPYDRVIEPNGGRPHFKGKVAVLMGPANMSSCESFLLMMKQCPRVTLVGEKSWGSSGNPKPVELSNGVTVFLPSWRDMLPDGTLLEGRGITPDVEIKAEHKEFAESDPVLNAALELLRK